MARLLILESKRLELVEELFGMARADQCAEADQTEQEAASLEKDIELLAGVMRSLKHPMA